MNSRDLIESAITLVKECGGQFKLSVIPISIVENETADLWNRAYHGDGLWVKIEIDESYYQINGDGVRILETHDDKMVDIISELIDSDVSKIVMEVCDEYEDKLKYFCCDGYVEDYVKFKLKLKRMLG